MLFKQHGAPTWIVFLFDLGICFISLILAYLLRFNFNIPPSESRYFYYIIPAVLAIRAASFYIAQTHKGIIRYSSTEDFTKIFFALASGSAFIMLVNLIRFYGFGTIYLLPFSVLVIDFITATLFLSVFRITTKVIYFELTNAKKDDVPILIYGAGEAGIITKRTLERDIRVNYKVIGFFDDNPLLKGKRIEGAMIYAGDKLERILKSSKAEYVVIAIMRLSAEKKSEIVEKSLACDKKVLTIPAVNNWINGELSANQIRNIKIDDLLGRQPIKLEEGKIRAQLYDKVVLVTGAAGSIGSELCRQIASYTPSKLILLDQSESPLYDLEIELIEKYGSYLCEVAIADVRNEKRMERVFSHFKPEVVFHAAAYKHVPLMEHNPSEAIRCNVLGTKVVADMAVAYGTKHFVMISTDKAVNPTNVMGASKRIAEMYVQSLNAVASTAFITTRFGNVLGSNGSVIPLFKKQIEKGGPITVTHPEVTRYFMTIPEACELVLEAGAIGNGGEIFLFDMGRSIKITDLAINMIKLAGLKPHSDIQIKYTGLRAGEKLYEELLADKENTMPTHHPKIMIAKVEPSNHEEINAAVTRLVELYDEQNNLDIVAQMKALVPEFISKNSIFSKLDAEV